MAYKAVIAINKKPQWVACDTSEEAEYMIDELQDDELAQAWGVYETATDRIVYIHPYVHEAYGKAGASAFIKSIARSPGNKSKIV